MNKIINWFKHWYRYKSDEPYIITVAIIGAFCLYGSIVMDHKKRFTVYVIILILIALWALFRSVTVKKNLVRKFMMTHNFAGQTQGLDLGTGTGYALVKLAHDTSVQHVTGVEDRYQYTISRLEKNTILAGVHDQVTFADADIQSLPYDENQFAVVTAVSANGNQLSTPKKSVYKSIANEMNRVVQPDGTIFMVNTPFMLRKYAREFKNQGNHVQFISNRIAWCFNLSSMVVTIKKN
jgi:ubiquinone/menaquinone biosynthesis C-methylase UbiE